MKKICLSIYLFLATIVLFSQDIITDKTLVVWASLENLEQRGGSVLTIDNRHDNFDGIVFGEIEPGRWMAGSDGFSRTNKEQTGSPAEVISGEDFIQIAIVYKGTKISIFRNGKLYDSYEINKPQEFSLGDCAILFGRRHIGVGQVQNSFAGKIKDARIYDFVLSSVQIKGLRSGSLKNSHQPLVWWDFENNGLQDVTRKFSNIQLVGDAYYDGESLVLGGNGSTLMVSADFIEYDWDKNLSVPSDILRNTRNLRERLLADPYRPAYHFCVPEGRGYPGDPNGAFWADGRYHLMYLYNREETGFCWGHVSSTDMLHWRHHPDGIGPGNGDEGCFSGGAFVDDDGSAYLTYWMLWGDKGIGIAKNLDSEYNLFRKFDTNPVIKSTEWGITEMKDKNGKDIMVGSADPSNIWKKDGKYYMLTGNLLVLNKIGRDHDSPENEKGDRLYLFSSDDLKNWEYMHRFYESDRKWTEASEDNMCPSFLPLPSSPDGGAPSDKHLLLFISHNLGCQYYIGDYENDYFTPNIHGRMTWVDQSYFAPEALIDGKGRQIMWSWIFDDRPGNMQAQYGWTGTYGLPRSLWLNEDGELGIRPVNELKKLRYDEKLLENITLQSGKEVVLDSLGTTLMELEITIETDKSKAINIDLCASPNGKEKTTIIFDPINKKLELDTGASGLEFGKKLVESAPFELKKGEALKLRVFIDKSIIEVFANDRQAIARRIYPTLGGSGIRITASGGTAKILSFKRWGMAASNPY